MSTLEERMTRPEAESAELRAMAERIVLRLAEDDEAAQRNRRVLAILSDMMFLPDERPTPGKPSTSRR